MRPPYSHPEEMPRPLRWGRQSFASQKIPYAASPFIRSLFEERRQRAKSCSLLPHSSFVGGSCCQFALLVVASHAREHFSREETERRARRTILDIGTGSHGPSPGTG